MAGSIPTDVASLIEAIADDRRRADATDLVQLMAGATGEKPKVWGGDSIGFGQYHYRYESGQEGDFFKIGFSPRKDRLTLYVMSGLRGFEDILEKLGPHRAGKSTIHLKRLEDADRQTLIELIEACVAHLDAVEDSMGAIPRMSKIPPRET